MESLFGNIETQQGYPAFADVIIPVPVEGIFTYKIPVEMRPYVTVGARVIIPFGNRKLLTGVVFKTHNQIPQRAVKLINDLLELEPSVTENQLKLLIWISEYYLCSVGEVLQAALPAGLKISTESKIQLYPGFQESDLENPSSTELELIRILNKASEISVADIPALLEIKSVTQLLKGLVSKRAIVIFEEAKQRYQPKFEAKFRLNPKFASAPVILKTLEELSNSPKQVLLIKAYTSLVPQFLKLQENNKGISKKALIEKAGVSDAVLRTLLNKGIFEEFKVQVPRFSFSGEQESKALQLSPVQEEAYGKIHEYFGENKPVLLYGVTGSGKTEIYIKLIQEVISNGGEALFLLPEIALTTQIVKRLYRFFGDDLAIYHSKFSDNERVETWQKVQSGKAKVVVGVRSAVFLPFNALGLVIVDEEHDPSYKQVDPVPRYSGRDTAAVLATFHNAKLVLGSATPSLESFANIKAEKWGLVKLEQRFGNAQLPDIQVIDIREEKALLRSKLEFTQTLLDALVETYQEGNQSILFQNRRGYSPQVTCNTCNWIPHCPQCDVSMSFHLSSNELRCHYCGHKQPVPRICVECGSTDLKPQGFGTQRLEDDLKTLHPEFNVARMDQDATRRKKSFQEMIEALEAGEIDVLVGTQMVAKGFDFEKVKLVGVFDFDRQLHYPDFRASERVIQTILQVAGRAGRKGDSGKVLIQTNQPKHQVIQWIKQHQFNQFLEVELQERERFLWPPYSYLIQLRFRGEKENEVATLAKSFGDKLNFELGPQYVLGPEVPPVSKVRNQYYWQLIIRIPKKTISIRAVKALIKSMVANSVTNNRKRSVEILINVDPL